MNLIIFLKIYLIISNSTTNRNIMTDESNFFFPPLEMTFYIIQCWISKVMAVFTMWNSPSSVSWLCIAFSSASSNSDRDTLTWNTAHAILPPGTSSLCSKIYLSRYFLEFNYIHPVWASFQWSTPVCLVELMVDKSSLSEGCGRNTPGKINTQLTTNTTVLMMQIRKYCSVVCLDPHNAWLFCSGFMCV